MKVQGLKKELSRKERDLELSEPVKQELADELLQRLKGLGTDANATLQQGQHQEAFDSVTVDKFFGLRMPIFSSLSLRFGNSRKSHHIWLWIDGA